MGTNSLFNICSQLKRFVRFSNLVLMRLFALHGIQLSCALLSKLRSTIDRLNLATFNECTNYMLQLGNELNC